MFFWLVLLGVYMGWVEAVYGTSPSKTAIPPTPPHDWYAPLPKPPEYLSNAYEPCPAAVKEAERVVRGKP